MTDTERDVEIRLKVIDQDISKIRGAQAAIGNFNGDATRGFRETARAAKNTEREIAQMTTSVSGGVTRMSGLMRTAIGAFLANGFIQMGRSALAAADNIDDLSKRFGISHEALSQYGYVARLTGTDLTALATGVRYSQKAISEANRGSKEYRDAIKSVGLSVEQLRGMAPQDAFEAIGVAIAGVSNEADRTSVAMKLFGRSGVDLIPVFEGGAEGIKGMREEADKLGITLDKLAAEKASRANDAIDSMTMAFSAMNRELAILAAPAVENMASKLGAVAADIRLEIDWQSARKASQEADWVIQQAFADAWRKGGKQGAIDYWSSYQEALSGIRANGMFARDVPLLPGMVKPEQTTAAVAALGAVTDAEKKAAEEAAKLAEQLRQLQPVASGLGLEISKISVSSTGAAITIDKTPEELIRELQALYQHAADSAKQPMILSVPVQIQAQGPLIGMSQEEIAALNRQMADVGNEGYRSLTVLENGVMSLGSAITGSLSNALGDAKAKLIDLGAIGRSVFSTIIGGLVSMGIGALFPALKPVLGLGGKALGGPISGPAIVGEYGKEIFIPDQPGRIIPSDKTAAIMGGGGGNVTIDARTTVDLRGRTPIFLSSPSSMRQLAEMITRTQEEKIQRTHKRRSRG